MSLNESIVEEAALTRFWELGNSVGHLPARCSATRQAGGQQLGPSETSVERDSYGEVVLVGRLREAIRRLNPANAYGNPHLTSPNGSGKEARATLRKSRIVHIERRLNP